MLLTAQITPVSLMADEQKGRYQLGRGFDMGEVGVTLGGYATANYINLKHAPWKAEVSDLSLFLSWDSGGRWRAFSEMEIGEAVVVDRDGSSASDAEFDLERTYIDWLGIDGMNVRLGKFLTPVGHWNQVHADPLVWTVSRPLTTKAGFANHSTGVMLYGDLEAGQGQLDYQLYVDATQALDPKKDQPSPPLELGAFDHGFGARLVYHTEDDALQWGFSVSDFKANNLPGRRTIGGLDFLWKTGGYELSAELVSRLDKGNSWSWFLQGVAPLGRRWFVVDRYENFNQLGFPGDVSTNSLGLVFRPRPPISFKLEYVGASEIEGLADDGFYASASVLF